jgi:uncharacterized protein YbjT (DUF2867 family)/uncharacterized protein YegP (UPF0339 family)
MILVVGATGRLGGMIAHRLLADQRPVRILVRPQSDFQSLVEAGAQPVIGDLKDPASLASACDGIEAVITTANAAARGGGDTVQSVDDAGNENLINAAAQAGVEKFVFTSSLLSDPNSPAPMFRAKAITEERVSASGMTFTITRADIHMDILIPLVIDVPLRDGAPIRVIGEGRRKHSFVAEQDVAAITVAALDNPAARNQSIIIGGPEPLSWQDIVSAIEREIGRNNPMETIPMGGQLPGLPDFVSGIMTGLETFDSAVDMGETASTYGVQLTPLISWFRQRPDIPWAHLERHAARLVHHVPMPGRFVVSKNAKGQYHFVLKAANGEIIAQSESYNSKAAAKNGIASVQNNAGSAIVVDETGDSVALPIAAAVAARSS